MINDFQVKSSRRLHFEDLEPSMFEMMVLEILDISGMYNDIRHYGKKGADQGVDIYCTEKNSDLTCFVQCKRYNNLKKSQLCAIVDKIIEGNKNTDGQSLLVVTSCEVRKEAYEDFDTYAKVKGFSKVEIWGESILTSKLHQEKYKTIMENYFGSDIDKEELARKRIEAAKLGEQLVNQSLLRKFVKLTNEDKYHLLEHPYDKFKVSKVIIRSIYDEDYPDTDDDGKHDSWFKSFPFNIYHDGIQMKIAPWTSETIVINPHGEWMLKNEFEKCKYDGEYMEINVDIIGNIPYSYIADIKEDGDEYFDYPIISCVFNGKSGPFKNIWYDFYDREMHGHIFFEKSSKRALITENDYWRLKRKYGLK